MITAARKLELLDRVVAVMAAQGKRSVLNGRGCVYRTPDGSRCAAGALISDEHYKPEMEGLPLGYSFEVTDALVASGVEFEAHEFVADLQHIHDDIHDFQAMRGKYAELRAEIEAEL